MAAIKKNTATPDLVQSSLTPTSFTQDNVKDLRKTVRAKRRALTPLQQRLASQRLLQQLKNNSFFLSAKHIAFYHAIDGELNLNPAIQAAWNAGKYCYLPRVKNNSQQLHFSRFKKNSTMQKNIFNISETQTGNFIQIKRLDLVFMPLVAFDNAGNRLGMGGGYYDYSFRHLLNKKFRKTRLIGLAHRCQQVDYLPKQTWDIVPDKIFSF